MTADQPAQPEPRELERVLKTLEKPALEVHELHRAARDAARLLREMARDFEMHANRHTDMCLAERLLPEDPCTCGLKAARERWKLQHVCAHHFESNPGMYDTTHRYCVHCGRAEGV